MDGTRVSIEPVVAEAAPVVLGEEQKDLGAAVAVRVLHALGGERDARGRAANRDAADPGDRLAPPGPAARDYDAGADADGSFCQRPKSFPSLSVQVANQPMPGTGIASFASPPSSLTLATPALMSSMSK